MEVIMSEARATAWKYASAVLAVLTVAAVVLALFFYGSARTSDLRAERAERALAMAQRDAAQKVAISEAKAREAERKAAERIAEIEAVQAAQQERIESEVEARTRDLRAGNLRLRREIAALATASVSRDAAATAESEAAAARGAELVAAAIGVGAACDARIQALIEAYDAARGGR